MKINKTDKGIAKGAAIGILSGVLSVLIGTMVVSYLIFNNMISLSILWVPVIITILLSAFIGNLIFSKVSGLNNIFNGMIFASIFCMAILILSVVFFDIPSLKLIYIVIAALLGSVMVCTKNIFPKKNKVYRKSRYG